jgi:hypothetical protein
VELGGNIMKPYREEKKKDGVYRRVFSENTEDKELVWHRDREDRIVVPINESGWKLQMDNELPIELKPNMEYFIPKETFHRVIKGDKDLIINIIKL